jgi:L-lactate dehydrogenase complex protein LldG
MLAQEHVVIVNSSDIKESADDITDSLKNNFNKAGKYTAFITGPSRTADIERVLSIGVHGPARLRILILEDKNGL